MDDICEAVKFHDTSDDLFPGQTDSHLPHIAWESANLVFRDLKRVLPNRNKALEEEKNSVAEKLSTIRQPFEHDLP